MHASKLPLHLRQPRELIDPWYRYESKVYLRRRLSCFLETRRYSATFGPNHYHRIPLQWRQNREFPKDRRYACFREATRVAERPDIESPRVTQRGHKQVHPDVL